MYLNLLSVFDLWNLCLIGLMKHGHFQVKAVKVNFTSDCIWPSTVNPPYVSGTKRALPRLKFWNMFVCLLVAFACLSWFQSCIPSFGGPRFDWQRRAHKCHRWSMIYLAWGASPNFDLKPMPLFKRLSKCPQTRMERRWEQSVFWHMECVLKSICSPSIVIFCFVSPGQWFCWWWR